MQMVSVLNKTKGRLPSLPLASLALDILGKDYDLSLVYVGKAESQKLNNEHRGKDKPTNILSFALSKNSGELVICPMVAKVEAKNFEKTFKNFLGFLVIHGMLHLKGMEHGSIMEKEENKYDKKYFSGPRRRDWHHPGDSSRNRKRKSIS